MRPSQPLSRLLKSTDLLPRAIRHVCPHTASGNHWRNAPRPEPKTAHSGRCVPRNGAAGEDTALLVGTVEILDRRDKRGRFLMQGQPWI